LKSYHVEGEAVSFREPVAMFTVNAAYASFQDWCLGF
jgi:hypothetical protein